MDEEDNDLMSAPVPETNENEEQEHEDSNPVLQQASVAATPSVQQRKSSSVAASPSVQQRKSSSVAATPSVQQRKSSSVAATPSVQQRTPGSSGSVSATPSSEQQRASSGSGSVSATPATQQEAADDNDAEDEVPSIPQRSVLELDLNYADMEMEFDLVLEELAADPALDKFRAEYSKVHAALQRSHQNERCLMDKYRELQGDIAAHSAQMASALRLANQDKQTIDALKKEVEKAWKLLDLSHEREKEAKDTMQALQAEIARLHEQAGQGDQIAVDQSESAESLVETRAALTRERNELVAEVARLRAHIDRVTDAQERTERARHELELRLEDMTQEMQVCRSDLQRETRRKDRAERELRNAKADIEAKIADTKNLQTQAAELQDYIEKTNNMLKEQKAMNETIAKEAESLTEHQQKLQKDYQSSLLSIDQLSQQNKQLAIKMKEREDELAALTQENLNMGKVRDTFIRKLRGADDARAQLEAELEAQQGSIARLERDLESSRRDIAAERRNIDALRHEKEVLKKNILGMQALCRNQESALKLMDQGKKRLEHETVAQRHAIFKHKFIISQMQRERDRSITESAALTEQNIQLTEAIKLKEIHICDLKKQVLEAESRLKRQQSLYEAVRSDRNLYSKNLIESQNEVTEAKRKLKMVLHQIDQLKEEIAARDALLQKDQRELERVQKDKEVVTAELEDLRVSLVNLKSQINSMEMEHQKLIKVLADSEAERNKQRKDMSQIMTERDILGTQLVRRNDELSLLYEKIRIQQSTLSKGEQQYRDRINDIRLLKLEIRKLRREKSLLNRSVHNLEDMRREMYHMHRSLLKERSKCKALENELQNPQNVHRWRRLEGTDPSTYEMILKIQTLQRRLIAKTQDATKKELEIQEKERLYLELKNVMARQPGPEVAEHLLLCQHTLRHKTRQMKSLVSELNMYESQIQEYKQDIDRVTEELFTIKKLYAEQKKQEQRRRSSVPVPVPVTLRRMSRFPKISTSSASARHQPPLGGGFKLPSVAANM